MDTMNASEPGVEPYYEAPPFQKISWQSLGKQSFEPQTHEKNAIKMDLAGVQNTASPYRTTSYNKARLANLAGAGQKFGLLEDQKALRMFELHASEKVQRNDRRLYLSRLAWVISTRFYWLAKRTLDLSVSLLAILAFLPIFIITAIAIRFDSPGPILFRQQRVGKWGRAFTCYKFRSMYIDAEKHKTDLMAMNEADGVVFKIRQDPRITRVGRFIRKLSIDELPQLLNVIQGNMSLVGPRPPVPYEVDRYEYDQYRRLNAVPGITGLQQVSGRSDITFARWVALDLEYIERQSLRKDLEILLRTIPAVITGKGAY